MTLQQAMNANIRIKPGQKVRTLGGWCRHDRVLVAGREVGTIQTRRGRGRTEIITIAGNIYVMGHNVDWLIEQIYDASKRRLAC